MKGPLPVEVLVVVNSLEMGGLERMATQLCLGLRDRYRMGVACLRGGGPLAEHLRDAGIPVYTWQEVPGGRRGFYTAPWRLRRLVRTIPARIIHSHNPTALVNGVAATLGRGGVHVIHTDHTRRLPDARRRMLMERWCAQAAFRFVTVSEHSKRDIVRWEHIPADRILVIANGIDTAPFAALPPPRFNPEGETVLGTAARLMEDKALDDMLEAVRLLRADGRRVRLDVAGTGSLRDALGAQAERLGIAGAVRFLGFQENMPAFLRGVDVALLSSFREGMPLAVIEAMAAGRPVVATAVGGVPEVVVDGETGLLTPPREPAAFAAAVARLLDDPNRARAFGEAGRARACRQFSLEAMTAQYARLYDAALNGRNGA